MKKFKRITALLAILIIIPVLTTGCYFKKQVESNEFGVIMDDGVAVSEIVGPGRYTDLGFYADIEVIDGQAKQVTWSDDSLWTIDKQVIGFGVSVTYARSQELAQMMWEKYHSAAVDDVALEKLVIARIPRVAKSVTSSRTLDAMLGREDLQQALIEQLSKELIEIGVTLLDIGVNDIAVDQAYADVLSQKAAASIKADLAKEETKTSQENLLKEEADTKIAVEKARRDNLVAEEKAKVYATSPEMLQLELARIYAEAMKSANTIYLPSDTTLNMFSGETRTVVPVE